MRFSNRAIFQYNSLPQGAPSIQETAVGTSTADATVNFQPWSSTKLSGNIAINSQTVGGYYEFIKTNPGFSTSDYVARPSNDAKVTISFSMFIPAATMVELEDQADAYQAEDLGASMPWLTMYSHAYNFTGLIGISLSAWADKNGNGTNGRLHIGRTASEGAHLYDGWFDIDSIDPITGSECRFKFPVNRSEITDRWFTLTVSVSTDTGDFDNWQGWQGPGATTSSFYARFYLTNSDGTVTMDCNNGNMFNLGPPMTGLPWNGTDWDSPNGHWIIIGDPQFNETVFTLTENYYLTNLWVSEGAMIDPKLYYDHFTNQGRPMKAATTINGVTAQTYVPIEDSSLWGNTSTQYFITAPNGVEYYSSGVPPSTTISTYTNLLGPSAYPDPV